MTSAVNSPALLADEKRSFFVGVLAMLFVCTKLLMWLMLSSASSLTVQWKW